MIIRISNVTVVREIMEQENISEKNKVKHLDKATAQCNMYITISTLYATGMCFGRDVKIDCDY